MPAHFAGVNVNYGASPCFLGARRRTDHSRTDLSRMSTDPLRYYRNRTRTGNEPDSESRANLLHEREKKKERESRTED